MFPLSGSVSPVHVITWTLLLLHSSTIDLIPINFDQDSTSGLNPVILIPGLEGSRLEAILDEPFPCQPETGKYFHVWLNQELFLPQNIDCLLQLLEIRPPGQQRVHVRVPSFGSTEVVEDLATNSFFAPDSAQYMYKLVDSLADAGYTRNLSIRAAPYDFRLSPCKTVFFGFCVTYELEDDYFKRLDGLIYETYLQNGNKPILICHSLGCLMMITYLNRKPQAWKDRYIERLVTVAAPFGGTVKALKAIAIGDNMGLFIYKSDNFKAAEQSFPSLAFLLPNPKVFGDKTIMKTPERSYKASDLPSIFEFLNATQVYKNWNNTRNIIPEIPFPGVHLTCIYSIGKKTPDSIKYLNQDDLYSARVDHETGDGTVNLSSLKYCHNWVDTDPRFDVQVKTFKKISHYDLIRNRESVKFITRLVTE